MATQKFFYGCLILLWQSGAIAVEFDNSITATAQWTVNTRNGESQSLNLSLIPEFNASFENGWQVQSSIRLRAEAINGMQIDDINRSSYSDYSMTVLPALIKHLKPAFLGYQREYSNRSAPDFIHY